MSAALKHKKLARLVRRATFYRYAPNNRAANTSMSVTIEYDAARAFVKALNGDRTERRVTLVHVMMKAVALALKNHIYFNYAHGSGRRLHVVDDIAIRTPVDLGDYPQFLMVERTDLKSLEEIAAIVDEKRRAMDGEDLTPFEKRMQAFRLPYNMLALAFMVMNALSALVSLVPPLEARALKNSRKWLGTFALSIPGTLGAVSGHGCLVKPSIAQLLCFKIEERSVVVDGKAVVRRRGEMTCTFDHRFIDGGQAIRFLNEIKRNIEAPEAYLQKTETEKLYPDTIGGVRPWGPANDLSS